MRISKKDLQDLLTELSEVSGIAANNSDAENKIPYLYLDHSPVNGGYRLVKYVEYSISGVFGRGSQSARLSAKEMYLYMQGLIAGMEYQNQKNS